MSDIARFLAAMGKKRVSVDHRFLSSMAEGKPESQRLLQSLKKAHAAGKIICPVHVEESIAESSSLPRDLRDEIFLLQNLLSDGFAFHSLAQQVRYQTATLLMPGALYATIRDVGHKAIPGPDTVSRTKANKWGHEAYTDRIGIIPYPTTSFKKETKSEEVVRFISNERGASMWRILEAIKTTGTLDTGRDEWELAVMIGGVLLGIQISAKDCDTLIHKVRHHEWEAIPYLWVHSRVSAQIEIENLAGFRDFKANDQLELSRLAVGINDAAVVLCDHGTAELVEQSKVLDILKDVRLFSTKQQDEAAAYIDTLTARAERT